MTIALSHGGGETILTASTPSTAVLVGTLDGVARIEKTNGTWEVTERTLPGQHVQPARVIQPLNGQRTVERGQCEGRRDRASRPHPHPSVHSGPIEKELGPMKVICDRGALLDATGGGLGAVWLDGRRMASDEGGHGGGDMIPGATLHGPRR